MREEILVLAPDVAKGLNYLHSLNPKIIHCDLKGANVLVWFICFYRKQLIFWPFSEAPPSQEEGKNIRLWHSTTSKLQFSGKYWHRNIRIYCSGDTAASSIQRKGWHLFVSITYQLAFWQIKDEANFDRKVWCFNIRNDFKHAFASYFWRRWANRKISNAAKDSLFEQLIVNCCRTDPIEYPSIRRCIEIQKQMKSQ